MVDVRFGGREIRTHDQQLKSSRRRQMLGYAGLRHRVFPAEVLPVEQVLVVNHMCWLRRDTALLNSTRWQLCSVSRMED